jgi:hypothetical protein
MRQRVEAQHSRQDAEIGMADQTLIVSIVGIGVAGVVGPAVTAWATRRASRQQFERDQAGKRRDDLRKLVDEAAELLAAGATNIRRLSSAAQMNQPPPAEVETWAQTVFSLQQRLRLRLPADHEVVETYDAVRLKLVAIGQRGHAAGAEQELVVEFERDRDTFLDAARRALERPVAIRSSRSRAAARSVGKPRLLDARPRESR